MEGDKLAVTLDGLIVWKGLGLHLLCHPSPTLGSPSSPEIQASALEIFCQRRNGNFLRDEMQVPNASQIEVTYE